LITPSIAVTLSILLFLVIGVYPQYDCHTLLIAINGGKILHILDPNNYEEVDGRIKKDWKKFLNIAGKML
jgi:hypothetical protein